MIPSTSPKEAPLACPPLPLCSLLSFTVGSTLSSLCSRSDPPLSLSLTLSHLTIFCFGQTIQLLFYLAKAALAYLPTALIVALRPFSSFWQAQNVKGFPLKLAPFCKLFAELGSTNKSVISLLFFFALTLATLSSSPSFLLCQSLWQELFSLSFCSIRLQWIPGHSFLPESNTADDLARRGALVVPSATPCSLSPLISRIHSCLFSDSRRTVSLKFFDTQVSRSSIFVEELVLPRHARCALFRLRCNGHSLLFSSYLSRIGRIKNPFCSACGHPSQNISHLILHSPATDSLRRLLFGNSLSLYNLWSRPWGVVLLLGLVPWSFVMPRSFGRGLVATTNNNSNLFIVLAQSH